MATEECKKKAAQYTELVGPDACSRESGRQRGRCMDAVYRRYLKWHCEPIHLPDYEQWFKEGKVSNAPYVHKGQKCVTHKQAKRIAKILLRQREAKTTTIKGLGALSDKVFATKGLLDKELVRIHFPFQPPEDYLDRGTYLRSTEVRGTSGESLGYKGDKRVYLSAPAPECPGGWFLLSRPDGGPVEQRSRNLRTGDIVYYLKNDPTRSDRSAKCDFLGKVPSYAHAFVSVRKSGVDSRYFIFHPRWGNVDQEDLELAKKSPLLFFLRPTTEARQIRKEWRESRERQRQLGERIESGGTDPTNISEGLEIQRLSNQLPPLVGNNSHSFLKNFINHPLCSELQELYKEEQIEKEKEAAAVRFSEGRAELVEQHLTDAGYNLSSIEKDVEAEEGLSWMEWAAIGAIAFVGYKFFFGGKRG